jgi:WD40 repeat protein
MPAVSWTFQSENPLTALAVSRESGEVILTDVTGRLMRLDPRGELESLTRLPAPARLLCFSGDGQWGAAIVGDGTAYRFSRGLEATWNLELPEPCLAVALTPYGNQLAAAMADGQTEIYNERKRRIVRFETVRPLAYLEFGVQAPLLYGAAEHGLVGCYDLAGSPVWQERLWSNIGDLSVTGDGDLIYLAASTHGIQTLDGDGGTVGSYVLEGTVRQVSCSFEPYRLAASSVERQFYWINSDGEVLWTATTPENVLKLVCNPFGTSVVCGMEDGTVLKMDWGGI